MIDEVPLLQERAPSYAAVRDAPVAGASPVSSLNSFDKYGTFVLFLALAPRTFSTSYLVMAIVNVNGQRLYRHLRLRVTTLL